MRGLKGVKVDMFSFVKALVGLNLFLAPGLALAGVEILPKGLKNLKEFEEDRAQICVENPLKLIKGGPLEEMENVRLIVENYCPMDKTISFLVPEAEKACKKDRREKTEVCQKLKEFKENPDSEARHYFSPDFDALMDITQVNPWQVVTHENGPASRAGVTHVQQGNVYIEITAELITLEKLETNADDYEAYLGYVEELGLPFIEEERIHVPFLKFRVMAQGISTLNVFLEILSFQSPEDDNPLELTGQLEKFSGHEMFFYFIPLKEVNIQHFSETLAIQVNGYRTRGRSNAVYSITLENDGFENVMKELLTHYDDL